MGNLNISANEKTGILPVGTPHSSRSRPQPQQGVDQKEIDRISRIPKPGSTKTNTIPRGNGESSVKKKNETPERSLFSRVVVDGLTSGNFWLAVLGSTAIALIIYCIIDLIRNSSSSSSNITMKH